MVTEEEKERIARAMRVDVPHYTGRGGIEPIDFIVSNGLDFLEGNIVKYVARYRHKGGVADLEKARVYLNWLMEREGRACG